MAQWLVLKSAKHYKTRQNIIGCVRVRWYLRQQETLDSIVVFMNGFNRQLVHIRENKHSAKKENKLPLTF